MGRCSLLQLGPAQIPLPPPFPMAGFPGSLWNEDRQLWGALCQENRSINPLLVTHQMDSVGRRSYLFIYTQGWNVSRREKWGPGNAAQRAMGVPSLERIPDWMRFWAAWTNGRALEWEIFRHPSKQFHDSVNPWALLQSQSWHNGSPFPLNSVLTVEVKYQAWLLRSAAFAGFFAALLLGCCWLGE